MALVLLEADGGVRTITLNAPERRNALDRALLDELAAAVATVAADEDARALVVRGAGKAFCAGADLANLFGDRTRPTSVLRDHLMSVYDAFLPIRRLSVPTIAAVQGAAVGAGLNIALACDVIVAGPRAGFGPTFTEIGLHPGGGCSWMLTERLGRAGATYALLNGDLVRGEDAVRLGLAEELADDPAARAHELATRWAARDRMLTAHVKRSVRIAAEADLATSLDFESWAQAASLASDEFEAFAARFTS